MAPRLPSGTQMDGATTRALVKLRKIYTGKGSIISATGAAAPVELVVGANNTMLVADSAATAGVKWANIVDANIATGTITLARLASGTSAQYPVCNISGVPVYVIMSGDVTQTNAGVTAIGAGKVTNAMLSTAAGDLGGAWQSVATTFANITNISGTTRYMKVGKTCMFTIDCTFSGVPVITGAAATVNLPFARNGNQDVLNYWFYKASTFVYYQGGGTSWQTSTGFLLQATGNGSAFLQPISSAAISAAFPFVFANGDRVFVSGTYETT